MGERGSYDSAYYSKQYESARQIDILGISCKSFVRDLYPCGFHAVAEDSPTDRLDRMLPNLKQALVNRGVHFDVRLVSPESSFVQTRMAEEGNANCRSDIDAVIDAVWALSEDVRQSGMQIAGSIEISLIKGNPYFSIFRSLGPRGQSQLLIGFLAQGRLGTRCPMVPLNGDEMRAMVQHHLSVLDLNRHTLFSWKGGGEPAFRDYRRDYDVFVSYNHRDRPEVEDLHRQLRRRGIRCWRDQEQLTGGDQYWRKLAGVIQETPCIIVCRGPNGYGSTQQSWEIPMSLSRLGLVRIILVLLPGATEPERDDPVARIFHLIDLRSGQGADLDRLVTAIRTPFGMNAQA